MRLAVSLATVWPLEAICADYMKTPKETPEGIAGKGRGKEEGCTFMIHCCM